MAFIVAEKGDLVTVYFTLAYTNGKVYVSNRGAQPLEILLGSNTFVPGVEDAILGMKIDETKTITLSQPFGPKIMELLLPLSRAEIPDHIQCENGKQVTITLPDNREITGVFKDVTDETAILDTNPPYAGQDMVLTVELVMIINKC